MDNLTLAYKLKKHYRSLGKPVPSDLLSIIDNYGNDISKISIQQNSQLNEFNNGGSHETNPNGGIQFGNNARVEEGETSVKTNNGDFIFSDRINLDGTGLKPMPNFANGENTGNQECGKPGQPPCPPNRKWMKIEDDPRYKKYLDTVRILKR